MLVEIQVPQTAIGARLTNHWQATVSLLVMKGYILLPTGNSYFKNVTKYGFQIKLISKCSIITQVPIVCAQTKAKRHVNQEKYRVVDLGNHMDITAKHWQVAAQVSQNIQHLYSLSLPVMKQSWGCFWPPLFQDFLSFLTQLMAKPCVPTMWLQRNSNILTAVGAVTPVWEAKRTVALDSGAQNANITDIAQNWKLTPGYRVYKTQEKHFACWNSLLLKDSFSSSHKCPLPNNVELVSRKIRILYRLTSVAYVLVVMSNPLLILVLFYGLWKTLGHVLTICYRVLKCLLCLFFRPLVWMACQSARVTVC